MLTLKCVISSQKQVVILGCVVSNQGIEVNDNKVDAIVNWPTPKILHDIKSFLGLASFYR